MRQDSWLRIAANNLPYLLMLALGAWIMAAGIPSPAWAWAAAAAYVIYGIVGSFWIMIFMCPHCGLHGSWQCPCYGKLSSLLVKKAPVPSFHAKFRKHIPVIVPLWFIPAIAGIIFMIRGFNLPMLILTVAFGLISFVILPLLSRGHGCQKCPQHDDCPWMKKGK